MPKRLLLVMISAICSLVILVGCSSEAPNKYDQLLDEEMCRELALTWNLSSDAEQEAALRDNPDNADMIEACQRISDYEFVGY